jgi:hypothetical protein
MWPIILSAAPGSRFFVIRPMVDTGSARTHMVIGTAVVRLLSAASTNARLVKRTHGSEGEHLAA